MKKVIVLAWLLMLSGLPLLGYAASDKDHEDSRIHYLTCDKDRKNIDDSYAASNRWSATWHGNIFTHTPQLGVSGAAHDDKEIHYLTWDGTCWSATWDATENRFRHAPIQNPKQIHLDAILNYLTWDRSLWSALRTGNGFKHLFAGDASDDKCSQYCVTCTDPSSKKLGHKEAVCTGGWIAGPFYRATLICGGPFSLTSGTCK